MNNFIEKFGERISTYWETNEGDKTQLLDEILEYANSVPERFKQELQEVYFDKEMAPLPLILEALSKNTSDWGEFYVDLQNKLFETAKTAEKPNEILTFLAEFAFIENDENPFIQRLIDKLLNEADSEYIHNQIAAISTLTNYLTNKSVNRSKIINKIQEKLHDKNWRVRVAAYNLLGYENLITADYRLSFSDRIRKIIFGKPDLG